MVSEIKGRDWQTDIRKTNWSFKGSDLFTFEVQKPKNVGLMAWKKIKGALVGKYTPTGAKVRDKWRNIVEEARAHKGM